MLASLVVQAMGVPRGEAPPDVPWPTSAPYQSKWSSPTAHSLYAKKLLLVPRAFDVLEMAQSLMAALSVQPGRWSWLIPPRMKPFCPTVDENLIIITVRPSPSIGFVVVVGPLGVVVVGFPPPTKPSFDSVKRIILKYVAIKVLGTCLSS